MVYRIPMYSPSLGMVAPQGRSLGWQGTEFEGGGLGLLIGLNQLVDSGLECGFFA